MLNQSIYIDCKWLLRRLYKIRHKVAKRHRGCLFDNLLIPSVLAMLGHFRAAYKFKDRRVEELDMLLFEFERVNAIIDLTSEEKIITEKEFAALFEYIERIYNSVVAYRASARKAKFTAGSNNDSGAETDN